MAASAVERCGAAGGCARHAAPLTLRRRRRRSFHKQRCAAGWLTGLGAKSSQLFATACRRAGAADTVVAAFSRAPALGLSITPDTARRILAASSQQARARARARRVACPDVHARGCR